MPPYNQDKFQNKYRITSARAPFWDYGWNSCWFQIPSHFPFVKLGAHVIMPNHVHGIVIINKPDDGRNAETQNVASLSEVDIPKDKWEKTNALKPKNQFGPQSKNLASIIRGFKVGVTKNARTINANFSWQPRYHDHIIRNKNSYQSISEYIINNPLKWSKHDFTMQPKNEQ